jgi:hypothetical protein
MGQRKWVDFNQQDSRMFVLKEISGLSFGMLRETYRQPSKNRVVHNKLAEWLLPKLHLSADGSGRVGSVRRDVLLPEGASDMLLDPVALCDAFERESGTRQNDLALHLKIRIEGQKPLHQWWEAARQFALVALVDDLRLPVIMVLHRPEGSGFRGANEPHLHLMAPARELDARGFGRTTHTACDQAHEEFASKWHTIAADLGLHMA